MYHTMMVTHFTYFKSYVPLLISSDILCVSLLGKLFGIS